MKKWDCDCINLPNVPIPTQTDETNEMTKEKSRTHKKERHIFFHTADVSILCINSLDLGIWPPFRTTGQEKTLHRLGTFLTFTWTLFFLCISWCQCYYVVVPVDMRMQENAKMSNLINGIKDLYWRIVSSPDWEALSTLTFQLYVFVFFSHGFGNANL